MGATDAMPDVNQITAPSGTVLTVALIEIDDWRRKEVVAVLSGFQGTSIREYASFRRLGRPASNDGAGL
jgi:hypothetical protein